MESYDKLSRYRELFNDDKSKAAAFDMIAERYYAGNFGTMSKADFETLMFHLYIERILDLGDSKFSSYSDYRLSKELGVPQSKISNLKVRKQLQYPREYDWKKSFNAISENIRYEKGKFVIQIPDINLFYEVKNAIEEEGGYIEMTLTSKLLQVSPQYFLDLLVITTDNQNKEALKKLLWKEYQKQREEEVFMEKPTFGESIKSLSSTAFKEILRAAVDTGMNVLAEYALNAM